MKGIQGRFCPLAGKNHRTNEEPKPTNGKETGKNPTSIGKNK
jgi:hypothetical protein